MSRDKKGDSDYYRFDSTGLAKAAAVSQTLLISGCEVSR